jgi:hypothetical protein
VGTKAVSIFIQISGFLLTARKVRDLSYGKYKITCWLVEQLYNQIFFSLEMEQKSIDSLS